MQCFPTKVFYRALLRLLSKKGNFAVVTPAWFFMRTLLNPVICWITYATMSNLAISIKKICLSYFITNTTPATMNILICFTSTKSILSLTILGKKGPHSVVLWIKFSIQNLVLRVSRRKKLPCPEKFLVASLFLY